MLDSSVLMKDITTRVERDQLLCNERKALLESKAKLKNLVIIDSLTDIYNRRHFEMQLNESWQFLTNTQGTLSLMMVGIDYFKLYNDGYGHIAIDEVLKKVATALANSMTNLTEFTARYGSEEFIVLATDITKQQAIDMGNTFCANVRNLNIPHKESPSGYITVSCGIAHVNLISSSNPGLLLQHADQALYTSKTNGCNQATIYKISNE